MTIILTMLFMCKPPPFLPPRGSLPVLSALSFASNQDQGGGLAQWLASGLLTKGSLVRGLAGLQFVVALSKSHLPAALIVLVQPASGLNLGSRGHTTELDRP